MTWLIAAAAFIVMAAACGLAWRLQHHTGHAGRGVPRDPGRHASPADDPQAPAAAARSPH